MVLEVVSNAEVDHCVTTSMCPTGNDDTPLSSSKEFALPDNTSTKEDATPPAAAPSTDTDSTETEETANNNGTTIQSITFDDWIDLQTRLILIPAVEEEGVGAIVSSFCPTRSNQEQAAQNPSHTNDESPLVGCILVGVESSSSVQEDWKTMEFTDILAALRQEATPLTLLFDSNSGPSNNDRVSDSDNNSDDNTEESSIHTAPPPTAEDEDSKNEPNSSDNFQTGLSSLSAWGSRMRAQATVAASKTASAVAIAAKERAKNMNTPSKEPNTQHGQKISAACDIFLQTSVGAFLPLSRAIQTKVTTSSLLLVRLSATQPCPTSWTYQWFVQVVHVDMGSSERTGTSQDGSVDNVSNDWMLLEGVTHAAFQPDVTLVGKRLRCEVQMVKSDSSWDDSSDDDEDGPGEDNMSRTELCEIPQTVSADLTLFNGARQALLRGANFGIFHGQENATNRTFRLEVSIGMRHRKPTSSLRIFQVAGTEGLSLTDEPIFHASARFNPKAKLLDIVLPGVAADSMLSALCTNGVFRLETPNRVSRESCLLALGIANYQGKPAELDASTILYFDRPAGLLGSLMDDSSSVSSGSVDSLSSAASAAQPVSTLRLSPPGKGEAPSSVRSPISTPTGSLSPRKPDDVSISAATSDRIVAMEEELEFLRTKLKRKDKVVSELQRSVTTSDASHQQIERQLSQCNEKLRASMTQTDNLRQQLNTNDKIIKSNEVRMLRLQSDHDVKISNLETEMDNRSHRILELEKTNRTMQNEKALLQAAVDARDAKLTKMGELQDSFTHLSDKVAQHDKVQTQLDTTNKQYEILRTDLSHAEQVEKECRAELQKAEEIIASMTQEREQIEDKAKSYQAQLEPLEKHNQLLKGERNSLKQKADSLSKEIARFCRHGRSTRDIEKMLGDHEALEEEVLALRKQKRKALEDAHLYRTSYEQSKEAEHLAGMDGETRQALERNVELERLLAEMTEYVAAKEMQLETMKQVNDQLQEEMHAMAKASFHKDEV